MQAISRDQIRALLKLLKTETGQNRPLLKTALSSAIQTNPSAVQQALEQDFPQQTPRAVVKVLEEICWEHLAADLARFAANIKPDLEEGLSILSRFTAPFRPIQSITNSLDRLAQPLRPLLLSSPNYASRAALLGRYFFQTLGFEVLPVSRQVKEHSFERFLRKKRGSPLCMACLYITVGKRYRVDASLIDLAGRILVHLETPGGRESLFIDPLDNGKILSAADCQHYIQTRQLAWHKDFFTPLPEHLIIRRFIANMIFTLNKVRDERRLSYLRNYLEIIQG